MTPHESLPLSDDQRNEEIELLERAYNDSDMHVEEVAISNTSGKIDDSRIALRGLKKFNLVLRHRVRVYNKAINRLNK